MVGIKSELFELEVAFAEVVACCMAVAEDEMGEGSMLRFEEEAL